MTNQQTRACSMMRERKEPPKTCGTCSNVEHETKTVRCPYRRYPMEQIKDWVGRPRYEHYAEDSACDEWEPRTADTLEQRYQQLAEVARDMFHLLDVRSIHPDAVIDGIEAHLEELGVEL